MRNFIIIMTVLLATLVANAEETFDLNVADNFFEETETVELIDIEAEAMRDIANEVEESENWMDCELNEDDVCVVEQETLEKETVKEATPKVYKDSNIRRKLKDGKIQEFDGDKYKIVPRTQTRYKKKVEKKIVRPVIVNEKKRHNISLLFGVAPDESITKRTHNPQRVEVEHEHNLNLGISYTYDLLEINEDLDLSVGGQVLTNETFMGSVGLSF